MIFVLFAGLAMITFSHVSPIHPGAANMLMRSQIENLECRPSPGPDTLLDGPEPTRATNFRLMGSYECYRPIFRSDERNPYIDRALEAESVHAKRAAIGVARRLKDDQMGPVAVRIEGDVDEDLRAELASIYRTELVSALGARRVRRSGGDDAGPTLVVHMRRVDVPELMSSAQLQLNDGHGGALWLDL